ncbi:MAG: hypothetical protein Q9219_000868 [cf. Caloplaca sp. 3 TL-2023]
MANVDYSLYLVTDSTPANLGNRKLEDVVKAAVEGGVTVVQYRDKHSDTADMVETAQKLRAICEPHQIPLIINDRVDVALASEAQGVHLGQTDMDPQVARRILGPKAIIGVTVSSIAEARTATQDGADYLGVGTVYATPTKKDTKSIIGTAGLGKILAAVPKQTPTVAIGGINTSNAYDVLLNSQNRVRKLDGVAVVSAIISAHDTKSAAQKLRHLVKQAKESPRTTAKTRTCATSVDTLLGQVNEIIKELGLKQPICHNMTNLVVQNFAANVALAM